MHRHVNRFGLAILITLGVIAWNQQRGHSYSPAPDAPSFFLMAQAVTGVQPTANYSSVNEQALGQVLDHQAPDHQALLDAVKVGDVLAVQALLEQGISPDAGDIYSGFALSYAAGQGDLVMMQLLLDRGATVDITADEGYTPLMEAILHQETAAVQLLLEHNANPNLLAAGMTGLGAAVTTGNVALVRLLLAAGADVHQPSQGQDLLELAKQQSNPELVDLIQTAAQSNRLGDTPIAQP
jgi:ankyrin repeat protein